MKKAVFIIMLILPNYSFSQQGWMPVSINPYTDTYFDFHFPNSQTGYGLSVGFQVIKTTNGGNNWNVVSAKGRDVQAIYFVNAETGFVCGDFGRIFKTIDGGYNWNICLQTSVSYYIQDIFFPDENTGYACSLERVYKTTDQGNSWDTLKTGLSNWLFKLYFTNNNTGYATGYAGLFKTSDGGLNWLNIADIRSEFGLVFINELTGYANGNYSGKIYKTTDGGTNWDTILNDDTLDVYNIFAIGSDTLYAGTNKGTILKSKDAGSTWQYQSLNFPILKNIIIGLYFINANTGFCSGGFNGPFFYYTTTGGTVGISTIGSEVPSSFKLHQNYPNPFNPETKIRFEIPAHIKEVNLSVYNSLGQEVAILVNEELKPGVYEYSFNASGLPSGMYFYRLITEKYSETRKMVVIK